MDKRLHNFKFYIGAQLKKGFAVHVYQSVNDWGVDLFAEKEGIK